MRILIGKMNPDIAFAQCTKNSVGNRMGQRVGIGVALGSAIRTDVYASQHKRPPFNQPMRVAADTDPDHSVLRASQCLGVLRALLLLRQEHHAPSGA